MTTLVWIGTAVLFAAGFAGTVVPGLPGAPLMVVGAVVHKLFLPEYLSWWSIAALALAAALSVVVDLACSLGGAKAMGASYWGIAGAGIGAAVGVFGGIPGVLAGAVLGALVFELIGTRKGLGEAAKAGLGAGLGLLASSLGRVAIASGMLAIFLIDCFVF
jgi:uncharacterized protein YqgC (DUF456 family)